MEVVIFLMLCAFSWAQLRRTKDPEFRFDNSLEVVIFNCFAHLAGPVKELRESELRFDDRFWKLLFLSAVRI